MRRARRTDANLTEIVAAYRKLGCSVWICNSEVDCAVGYGGWCELVECKDGAKSPSRRVLTLAQVAFRKTWTGGVRLVQSIDDVAIHVANIRQRHQDITQAALGRIVKENK